MNNTLQIAIVGFGAFGQFLMDTWSQMDQVTVSMVVDADPSRLPTGTGLITSTRWQDVLSAPNIDIVVIVTAPSSHADIAVACMEAGKHVFIEKPVALSMEEYNRILNARNRSGKVASIDHIMRFNPLLISLKSIIDSGAFGRLRRADIENYAQDETMGTDHWFWNTDVSGGILIEHAVHFIDLIHFFQPSEVVEVTGLGQLRDHKLEDQVIASIKYADGLIATHYHSFSRPTFFETTSIRLSFDLADIDLSGWVPLTGRINVTTDKEGLRQLHALPGFQITRNHPLIPRIVRSSGIPYPVDVHLEASFGLNESKDEVYRSCVQHSLLNLVLHIQQPEQVALIAPLEIGRSCLHIGLSANSMARGH